MVKPKDMGKVGSEEPLEEKSGAVPEVATVAADDDADSIFACVPCGKVN